MLKIIYDVDSKKFKSIKYQDCIVDGVETVTLSPVGVVFQDAAGQEVEFKKALVEPDRSGTQETHWQLLLGKEVVANINAYVGNSATMYGELERSPQFDRYRIYFIPQEQLYDHDPSYDRIAREAKAKGGFRLKDTETGEVFWCVSFVADGRNVHFECGDLL